MYAVIKTGGKQYRVTPEQKLKIEKIDKKEGEKIVFDEVLLLSDGNKLQIGTPTLKTTVEAKITRQGRGKKIQIIKFKRRKHHRKQMGHRQYFTEIEIISMGGMKATKTKKENKKDTTNKTNNEGGKVAETTKTNQVATKKKAVKKTTTKTKTTSKTKSKKE
jgi:large subunit ribosomal protein L21